MTENDPKPPADRAAVRFPPPIVPLLTILAGWGLAKLWPVVLPDLLSASVRPWFGGLVCIGAVASLGLPAVVLFHRKGESEIPWTPTGQIVESGPYRFTRNPMYLMMVILCIGFSIALWNFWILALTPLCVLVLRIWAIDPEEAYLERKFGDDYLAYKRRVRRWI